jgi:hypothetical protein
MVAALQFKQHGQETAMSETYSLPTEPEGMAAALVERFNSGKISALMGLNEPEAVLSDVVRRGADGFWRYLIDNNQGTAVRQPA